jgi:hypothetical protein
VDDMYVSNAAINALRVLIPRPSGSCLPEPQGCQLRLALPWAALARAPP